MVCIPDLLLRSKLHLVSNQSHIPSSPLVLQGMGGPLVWEAVRETEVVGTTQKQQGLNRWMCFFYPGNVICLNDLRSPRARPAAAVVFLRLGCQSQTLYLWESRPAGSSCPRCRTWTGLLWFIGASPFETCRNGVWLGSTHVSGRVNGDGSVASLQGKHRKGKRGVQRAWDFASAVWSYFTRRAVIGSTGELEW